MSEDIAQEIMDHYDEWDDKVKLRSFRARMEHKHNSRFYGRVQ